MGITLKYKNIKSVTSLEFIWGGVFPALTHKSMLCLKVRSKLLSMNHLLLFSQTSLDTERTTTILQRIADAIFDGRSLLILFICIALSMLLTKIIAFGMRKLSRLVRRGADRTSDLTTVNNLRAFETWLTLSIAIVRLMMFVFAIYLWWALTHDGQNSNTNALIGASAIMVVIIGGIVGPLLRDFAFGAGMMAERWFTVGDLITVEFPAVQGVVERITLRSTRIRGLNGEIIWLSNQTISGVRVAHKGVWPNAIEIFVNDPVAVEKLVDRTNKLLPGGLALLASPLTIVDVVQRDEDIWQVTVIGETAPGREWIIQDRAVEIMKSLDEKSKKPILHVDPVVRHADPETEKELHRAVKNARKTRRRLNYRKIVGRQLAAIALEGDTKAKLTRPRFVQVVKRTHEQHRRKSSKQKI